MADAPLIVTAQFPADLHAWATSLRRSDDRVVIGKAVATTISRNRWKTFIWRMIRGMDDRAGLCATCVCVTGPC